MSYIEYTTLNAKKDWLFDAQDAHVQEKSAIKAVYQDNDTGNQFLLYGFNFTFDQSGRINGGTVTNMEYADGKGKLFAFHGDFSYNVVANKPLFETQNNLELWIVKDADTMKGSKKGDYLNAGQGDDHISGGKGNDDIRGEDGNDTLLGGAGDDRIWGDSHNDTMTGGKGRDMFTFFIGDGHDVITDFDVKQDGFEADWDSVQSIFKSGRNTVIDFGDDSTITLLDVKPNQIHEDHFAF